MIQRTKIGMRRRITSTSPSKSLNLTKQHKLLSMLEKAYEEPQSLPQPVDGSRLRRTPSEAVQRRNLVRYRGGKAELEQDYRMLETLGKGGFGTVKRAIHRPTGLTRAIKAVATGRHDQPSAEEWEIMLGEVEALVGLTHPNIVQLHEYYRDEAVLYLIEEYCSGGTLEALVEKKGPQ